MHRLILAAAFLAVAAGCGSDPRRCCDAYSSTEEKGIYCLAHRDAVLRFVREPRDPEQRRARLDWFRTFSRTLAALEDSDAIDARIAPLEKDRPEFWREYSKQHFWAGRDTNLSLQVRGELMKCGFTHAVHELELDLSPRP
ncbi:MAG: hypothetical protein JO332_16830 [Planctomycetaceae bacterium]|nr:hypothetical protein [Planctomycetaceae bacterium]